MLNISRNIVLFVSFFERTNIWFILFSLDLLYRDNEQFLAILFGLFPCQIFFEVLLLFDSFVCFKIFWNIFCEKYGFYALCLVIFVVRFTVLRSVDSICVLKTCPASAGILFFPLIFWRYKHIIYFIWSWSFVSR